MKPLSSTAWLLIGTLGIYPLSGAMIKKNTGAGVCLCVVNSSLPQPGADNMCLLKCLVCFLINMISD